jgi:O-antigen/teichoic acid export membrane protein
MAGAGYQSARLATQVVAALFNFALNLYLIPRYSWVGAAWASLATDGGLALLLWIVVFWLAKKGDYAYSAA